MRKGGEKQRSWLGPRAHRAGAAEELGEPVGSGSQWGGGRGVGLGTSLSLWWAFPDTEHPWPWSVNPPTVSHPFSHPCATVNQNTSAHISSIRSGSAAASLVEHSGC